MFLKEFQTSLRLLYNSVLSQIYCNHLDRFNRSNHRQSSVVESVDISDIFPLYSTIKHTSVEWSQNFDFLINGSLFTDSDTLGAFIAEHPYPIERGVEIDCVQHHPEPTPHQRVKQSEWVSDAQATKRFVLSTCYDGTVSAWNYEGERLGFLKCSDRSLKALSVIPDQSSANVVKFAAGSSDQNVLVGAFHYEYNEFIISKIGIGHEESVECVAASSDGLKLASGGTDTYLKIWDIANIPLNFANNPNGRHVASRTQSRNKMTPMFTLAGHRDQVVGVCWKSPSEVVTASWDHSIHVWNVEYLERVRALSGDCCFTDVAYSPLNHLLLSTCSDKSVRMWDVRSTEGSMVKALFNSHSKWASSVDWSKTNSNLFLSSDFAGLLKLWDIRNTKSPLYDMKTCAKRILCCDYSNPEYLVGGGTDGCLTMFKAM
ncbi:WD domain, G-beta repeat-containing domain protein [Trichinella spiralis]|nr:WD domain, G-beta repeat-containing domain protein [Trichinella spiralis]